MSRKEPAEPSVSESGLTLKGLEKFGQPERKNPQGQAAEETVFRNSFKPRVTELKSPIS
jgi:hypothetical protein